jgi:NADH-quinone oxidoreductase subunit G
MAAIADTQTVNITVNNVPLVVPKGELVVEAVKRLGIEIPIFCYHPRMKPVGMCRMCLVEVGSTGPDGSVRMMPKPQAACTLGASEGLVIITDSEKLYADRRGVLEFLLINHPLDCPICDRGGECPLQNNTLFYGPSTSRFVEMKRHNKKAFPLSAHVKLDLERCIQCGRCVRFTEEISGDNQLGWRFRGANMQPTTFEMSDFDSKFSGNVIEICPVGALTSANYRFRARPWDLETTPSVCTLCSNGCNIWFDHRLDKMVRINGRTNEVVNEEWTCDRGKFGHEFYNSEDRLNKVLRREGDRLVESDWSLAYADIKKAFVGSESAVLVGPSNSNEDLFLLKSLFDQSFKSSHYDYRMTASVPTRKLPVEATIAGLERASGLFVFGTSLSDDLPIVHLRVRKAWFKNGAKVIVATDAPTDVDPFAELILRYRPGTGAALIDALSGSISAQEGENQTGVAAASISQAAQLIKDLKMSFVSSHAIFREAGGVAAANKFTALAQSLEVACSVFALNANDQGAQELGLVPSSGGLDTKAILEGCAAGKIKALWLAGVDPLSACPDRELAQRALEGVEFLVVQNFAMTEAVHYASLVLPQTAPAEAEGTFTNCERRVQKLEPALKAKGNAKPGWKVYNELAFRVDGTQPFTSVREVAEAMAQHNPAFLHALTDTTAKEGVLLS